MVATAVAAVQAIADQLALQGHLGRLDGNGMAQQLVHRFVPLQKLMDDLVKALLEFLVELLVAGELVRLRGQGLDSPESHGSLWQPRLGRQLGGGHWAARGLAFGINYPPTALVLGIEPAGALVDN